MLKGKHIMARKVCEDMTFSAEIHIGKQSGNMARSVVLKHRISFSYDPDTYGNGFYMYVEGKDQPFGGQGYDIRYDTDFDSDYPMGFILSFYANRYDGKNGAWKLTGIRVHEADFEVMDS